MSDSSQPTSQTPSQPSAATAAVPASPEPAAPASTTPTAEAKPAEGAKPAEPKPEAKPAEGKPAEAAKPEEGAKPAEGQQKPVLPETYTITPPEGVKVDDSFVAAMSPAFKDAALTQEQVNKLAGTFIGYQQGLVKQMLTRDLEVTMKDPDLGGMNWGKTQGYINDALAAFTTPEFRSKLEAWGVANDLEFVRVFAAVGRAMRGDVPARGQPTSAAEESVADRIYGRAKKVGNA